MAAAILVLLIIRVAPAYHVTDKFSIGGIVAGGYQYDGEDRSDGGAVTFRPHVSYQPSERDELFAKLGFAAGNGINDSTQFCTGTVGCRS